MTADRRGLDELVIAESTVWANIEEWAQQGVNTILPITSAEGEARLLDLQMTTWSSQGAVTLYCGGILADHGWLKLFGGGTDEMPALADHITGIEEGRGAGICGVDVLGGVFAINWGAFPGDEHRIWYWAPDTLDWQGGNWKHIDLLWAALTGDLDEFYGGLRWPGWQKDVGSLAVDEGFTLTPEPFTVEGRDTSQSHKAVVPMVEICRVMQKFTKPGGIFAKTSPRYPLYWAKGRHYRPDIDRFIAVKDLTDVEKPLWPQLQRLIDAGPHRVLPPDPEVADRRLLHLERGVDTGIGAMVYHCSTLLVDHGWLRLFGSGNDEDDSRDLVGGLSRGEAWMVGYDVLGGIYAVNLGLFDDFAIGEMVHWSTATARLHPMGFAYEDFLRWALSGGLDSYYPGMRWAGWETDVEALDLHHGIINGTPTPMSAIVDWWTITTADTTTPYLMTWPRTDATATG